MKTAHTTTATELPVSYTDVEAAALQLKVQAHRTPVMTSRTVDKLTQSQVFFKCENFQRTGSFKFRGAYNALAQLSNKQKHRGVLTYSSGNHAQAIALASQLLGISATIVMPEDAPAIKKIATRNYGAQMIFYNQQETNREEFTQKIAEERDLTMVLPYENRQVIAGQGTAAKELIEEVGRLDILLVCCGGGGLLSGCAIAANILSPGCRVIGVEAAKADTAPTCSLGKLTLTEVGCASAVSSLANHLRPLVLHYVHDMVTVSEEDILNAMFFLWERMKIVVEPRGALATAALLSGIVNAPDERIGVIVSGGNVDCHSLLRLYSTEVAQGRRYLYADEPSHLQ